LSPCSCRKVFIFIQETIAILSKANPEIGVKLSLEGSLVADSFAVIAKDDKTDFSAIAYELLSQAFSLYEETISEPKTQQRCIEVITGTLLASKSLSSEDYEGMITKTTQFAAKVLKKPEQCQLVALCAYLFYPVGSSEEIKYSNPQRALECLQRSLKLADACTTANPSNVRLFVELLDHYVFFFEKKNPVITHIYITGLVALIKEHISSRDGTGDQGVAEAKAHFSGIVQYIKAKKSDPGTAELFAPVQTDNIGT
jgi:vacuolar protein sorting-associated protein 35